MRIEIVVEAPTHDAVDSIDVIALGNEVARLVRNQISGEVVELVHAAVGPRHSIAVPADEDYDETAEPADERDFDHDDELADALDDIDFKDVDHGSEDE